MNQIIRYLLFIGGKAFISEEILKSHFNSKHFDQRIKTRKDGTFECKICNRELKKYGHAERHMKLFHPADGEGDGEGEDADDDPLEDSEIKVEVCNLFWIMHPNT